MAELIDVDLDGKKVPALLGLPSGQGPHPGILVMHHQEGLSPFTRDLVDKLAKLGCVALSVSNYHACPPDADMQTKRESVRDGQLTRDAGAGIAFLESHPLVLKGNLAVIGHCMGGRTAFLAASVFPVFAAAIAYYGGGVYRKTIGGMPVGDRLKNIQCPVIGFWGGRDPIIPNADVDRIEAELKRAGVPCEFHRYPEAGHAFCNFTVPADFRADADADSWRKTVAFLRRELKLPRD